MKPFIHYPISRTLPLLLFLLMALPARAQITVADGVVAIDDTDGQCSLLEAIENANDTTDGQPHDDCGPGDETGADTINLPEGATFTLTDANTGGGFAGDFNTTGLGLSGLPPILDPLTIEGNGSMIERDADAGNFRILTVVNDDDDDGALTLNNATLRGGVTSGTGASGDSFGGGLLTAGATVTLNRTTVAGNTARSSNGGGGGLYSTFSGDLTLNRSTVSGNSAPTSPGGGIFCGSGSLALTHSTVSGNSANNAGGGIYTRCTTTLTHSSVVNNTGSQDGGLFVNFGATTLRNTLMAANSGGGSPNCGVGTGTVTPEGVNLTDDDTGGCGLTEAADLVLNSVDPDGTIGDLAGNGGPTQTHALLFGSSAIDAADATICEETGNDTDQRGEDRPLDGNNDDTADCDVGSFESMEITPPTELVVNDTGDGADDAPGNGVCETESGECTLRAAIEEANALDGADEIVFDAALAGVPITLTGNQITITSELTITGQGADQISIDGDGDSRIFEITADGDVEIEGVTLTGGKVPLGGSGPGGGGGAIFNAGTLDITNSTLSGNTAGDGLDGASPAARGGDGGAISNAGILTITASTLSNNTAGDGGDSFDGSAGSGGSGGGGGAIANVGTMDITNSTLAGNVTGEGGAGSSNSKRGPGGAIRNTGSATSTITATTITGNTGRVGAAINQPELSGAGSLTLVNTLIAGNTDPEVDGRNCFANDQTELIDGGGNLDDGETCGFGASSLVNATAGLNPAGLADNDGPTQTIALTGDSDAIDSPLADAGCPDTDQRGEERPLDGNNDTVADCDIGAFEAPAIQPIPVNESSIGVGVVAVDADGLCSLIEAIENANDTDTGQPHTDCLPGAPGNMDTILLPEGATFTLTDANTGGGFSDDHDGPDLGLSGLPPILDPLTIKGNGSEIICGGCDSEDTGATNFRILTVINDTNKNGALTLNDATLHNGVTSGGAGSSGSLGLGGGLLNAGAMVTLNRVTMAGNIARAAHIGGGGLFSGFSGASLTLNRSTISDNSGPNGPGGGIYCSTGSLTLNHSTVSGNSANFGGGIITGCTTTLTHSSVVGNTAGPGGGLFNNNGTLTLRNTLITANSGSPANCYNSGIGTVTLEGINLTDDDSSPEPCGLEERADLVLESNGGTIGPLAGNGGPTQTHALLAGSSAIDAADATICEETGNDTDQRGEDRPGPASLLCDVGSVEFQGEPLSPVTSVELTAAEDTNGEGWRFLTSSVIGETYNGLLGGEDGLWTQGVTGARYSGGDPNVYLFDQTAFDWDAAFDLNDEIGPGNGFIIYVFEDDEYGGEVDGGFPKTLESAGDWLPFDGTFEYTGLAYDDESENPNVNYYLLGNPHPIPLDFCAFDETSIATSIDIWDPAANSGNGEYVNLNCPGGDDVHIAPFQAFWVRTDDDSPTLGIPEDAYLPGSVEGFFKKPSQGSKPWEGLALLSLTVHSHPPAGGFTNTARILLSEDGTPGLDKHDGLKLSPAGLAQRWLNFYSMDVDGRAPDGSGQAYAFQSLPSDLLESSEKVSIPLDIETTESGTFTLTWELPEQAAISASYFLRDNQTGQAIELREGGDYRFEIESVAVQPFQGSKPWKDSGEEATHPMSVPAPMVASVSNTHRMSTEAEPRFELLIAAAGVDGLAELGDLPEAFTLDQNYPNPFNPSTVIRYQLPVNSQVRLELFDMLGRRVATLVEGQVAAGRHSVNFDASNLSSGVYLYRLQANGPNGANQIFTKKLTLIK